MPANPVSAWRQRFQADAHGAAADLRLALIDARALGVGDLHGAESRLEVLRERQRDLVRRGAHGAADQRTRMIEEGVRVRATASPAPRAEAITTMMRVRMVCSLKGELARGG